MLLILALLLAAQPIEVERIFGPEIATGPYKHPACFTELKNGDLYLVYNPVKTGRSPLIVARSVDSGKSWAQLASLEAQPGEFSYPAIIEAKDGRLHVTYTWNRRHIKHVILDPAK